MSKSRKTAELVLLTSGLIGLMVITMADETNDFYYVGMGGLYFSLGCNALLKLVDFIHSIAIEDGCLRETEHEEEV